MAVFLCCIRSVGAHLFNEPRVQRGQKDNVTLLWSSRALAEQLQNALDLGQLDIARYRLSGSSDHRRRVWETASKEAVMTHSVLQDVSGDVSTTHDERRHEAQSTFDGPLIPQ